MQARYVVLALALAVGGLAIWLWPREPPSIEVLLERKVIQLTRSAERRQVGEVMEHVSERFRTQEGWDKQQVRQVLAGQLLRGQWVRIFITDIRVRVLSPTEAEVASTFIFGRSQAENLQELAQESVLSSYRIDTRFELEPDGEWRALSATHRRVDPTELF